MVRAPPDAGFENIIAQLRLGSQYSAICYQEFSARFCELFYK
jgi:hypothetical protein